MRPARIRKGRICKTTNKQADMIMVGFCFHLLAADGVVPAAGLKPARARAPLSLEGDSTGQDSANPGYIKCFPCTSRNRHEDPVQS